MAFEFEILWLIYFHQKNFYQSVHPVFQIRQTLPMTLHQSIFPQAALFQSFKFSLKVILKQILSLLQLKPNKTLINKQSMSTKLKLRQLHVKVGLVSLNTVPLDFKRNFNHIMKSIQECIDLGCSIRIGSELEVSGYGCADHFAEYDTIYHSWDIIRDILKSGITENIVCELGTPILHKAALYNARVIIYQSKVIAIRVKTIAADGDMYNETRCFSTWKFKRQVGEFQLPQVIQELTGQVTVPIGVFIVNYKDTSVAYEICQEAWISNNPMIDAALDGAEIFINGSASQVVRGKLKRKIQMIQQLTQRHGGAYIYVNTKGLLQRQYFDGGNMVSQNGRVIYLSQLHRLQDVCVMPVVINLNKIRSFRLSNKSFQKQSHGVSRIPRVFIDKYIAVNDEQYTVDSPQHLAKLQRIRGMYEIPHATYQPSLYLWDALKMSKASGFHISLSGGKNSCSVALIVYNLCCLLYNHITQKKNQQDTILRDLRRIVKNPSYVPNSPKDICSKLLFTTYMETENSTRETKQRAAEIAKELNANHTIVDFEKIYLSFKEIGKKFLGTELKFKVQGGTECQDIALAGAQARTRMVLSYFISQLALQKHNRQGFLIKLASLHLDYLLRGYFTKYDCSSADINPIGSFSSKRIKQFLIWNSKLHDFPFIKDVLQQKVTTELKPFVEGLTKSVEQEMSLTHEELALFAQLRRINKLGPVSMFDHIYSTRQYTTIPELAQKIKVFFRHYSLNRHKMSTMTPIFHFNPQGCDDSRLDQRPITYATDWSYQFEILDQRVRELTRGSSTRKESWAKSGMKGVVSPETIPPILLKKSDIQPKIGSEEEKEIQWEGNGRMFQIEGNETQSSFLSGNSSRINGCKVFYQQNGKLDYQRSIESPQRFITEYKFVTRVDRRGNKA